MKQRTRPSTPRPDDEFDCVARSKIDATARRATDADASGEVCRVAHNGQIGRRLTLEQPRSDDDGRLESRKCSTPDSAVKQQQPESDQQQLQQQTSRLVFGLNARANKVKHDKYAMQRCEHIATGPAPSDLARANELAERPAEHKKSATKDERKMVNAKQTSKQAEPEPNKIDQQHVVVESGEGKPKKMQFNIPPPPKMASKLLAGHNTSVVSNAKSRIYDKKPKIGTGSLVEGVESVIPKSILCGFKPPRLADVNVSQARRVWEAGELFAKTRRSARLNKSLSSDAISSSGELDLWRQQRQLSSKLHNGWAMASVVSSKRQAFASMDSINASYPAAGAASAKVLSRGSVLERVRQFEQIPADDDDHDELPTGERREVCAIIRDGAQEPAPPTTPIARRRSSSGSSLARLHTRRSSSMRRQSSLSSQSNIPKFYHPFGKPNTYELEMQRRAIAKCFDSLPERRAALGAAPSAATRRHFGLIAQACGLSQYCKMYLYEYVKNGLLRDANAGKDETTINKRTTSLRRKISAHSRPSANSELKSIKKDSIRRLSKSNSLDVSRMNSMAGARDKDIVLEKLDKQKQAKSLGAPSFVTCDEFLTCWLKLTASSFDVCSKLMHLITGSSRQDEQEVRSHLVPDDFIPLVQCVIDEHPGLKFLKSAPDFHMRYIQTVIARIYFNINYTWNGKINLAQLRRSNLIKVLSQLDSSENINRIEDYFSYEHFYVIYCKFWLLDQDRDLLLSAADLAKHQDSSISKLIIERIFMGINSKQIQATGKMSYSDFVWFLLAEEDKRHPRATEYWFRLLDLDGDGFISLYEMEHFYGELERRLGQMSIEALPFLDSACQMFDLINPRQPNKISLSDLKHSKLAGVFFDTFINIEKYLENESREFVSCRDSYQDATGRRLTDWDRYASAEYESLVASEPASQKMSMSLSLEDDFGDQLDSGGSTLGVRV